MFRFSWLLCCLTFLSLPNALPAQKAIPESIHSWIKVAPPKVGSDEWSAARASSYEWQVSMKDGQPFAHRRNARAEATDGLPPLIKKTRGPHPQPGEIHSYQVPDGWLISFNPGDGLGGLWWYGQDGRQSYQISNDQIIQFLPTRRAIYALEGVAGAKQARGRIVQIQRNAQGQWLSSTFADLGHMPEVGMIDRDDNFLVCATDALIQVKPDQTQTVLVEKAFWDGLSPRSIAISSLGDVYLGMHQGVSLVYKLKDAYVTEWFLPNKDFLLAKPK